jgi:hypothetical protein
MKDAYHTALYYLIGKYPQHSFKQYTGSFNKRLSNAKVKDRQALIDSATERDIINGIHDLSKREGIEADDLTLFRLLNTYHLSFSIKKELRQQLTNMNLEFSE